MMIDFALEGGGRVEGKSPEESIYQACLLRFRPIMMTTMGGPARRSAAGSWKRHRLGAASSPWDHDCRRSRRHQSGSYLVHHAGRFICTLTDLPKKFDRYKIGNSIA